MLRKRIVTTLVLIVAMIGYVHGPSWARTVPVSDCTAHSSWPEGCGVGASHCQANFTCEAEDSAPTCTNSGTPRDAASAGSTLTCSNMEGCPECPPTTSMTCSTSFSYNYTEGWNSSGSAEAGVLCAKVKAQVGHDLGRTISGSVSCSKEIGPCRSGGVKLTLNVTEGITMSMDTTLTLTSKNIDDGSGQCAQVGTTICGPEEVYTKTETMTYDEFGDAACSNLAEATCGYGH
jgi:hypothetical protein